jgi:hypothetical protein
VHYISLAEHLGYDPATMWSLAWTLFFIRIVLGFAVGIDDVMHGFRHPGIDAAKRAREARSIRRANIVVSVLHVLMLAAFAFAAPLIAAT